MQPVTLHMCLNLQGEKQAEHQPLLNKIHGREPAGFPVASLRELTSAMPEG